jgi:HSP20 family protein
MNGITDFYNDIFSELNRLQQTMDSSFRSGGSRSIRALARRSFPAISVGNTPDAIEVMALAPGISPEAMQITVDKGLLVIAGERADDLQVEGAGNRAIYAQERFKGSFRRVISLPDDVDPQKIEATARDGLLRIKVSRREASKPRQITVN